MNNFSAETRSFRSGFAIGCCSHFGPSKARSSKPLSWAFFQESSRGGSGTNIDAENKRTTKSADLREKVRADGRFMFTRETEITASCACCRNLYKCRRQRNCASRRQRSTVCPSIRCGAATRKPRTCIVHFPVRCGRCDRYSRSFVTSLVVRSSKSLPECCINCMFEGGPRPPCLQFLERD
jgi:hypothetical protein